MNDIIDFSGDKRTFENTMIPFSQLDADAAGFSGVLSFYSSVAPDKKLRDASNEVSMEFNNFISAIYTNKKLYEAVKAVKKNMHEAGTWKDLSFEDQQVVNKILFDYEQSGIDFPPEK